ncbi:hypothetical protein C8R46DRAFT_75537 [Mycena filopes]|nr:hypothetical protein C8R46DRAFT_75537 [Mycena filopes]
MLLLRHRCGWLTRSVLVKYRRHSSTPPSKSGGGVSAPAPPHSQTFTSRLLTPLTAYGRAARTKPYLVQLSTSLLIWFTGDVLAQYIEQSSQPTPAAADPSWDRPRTLRALIIGAGTAIPSWHWFNLLSRSFTTLPVWPAIAARVVTQQLVFAPVFSVYFFFSQSLLSGGTVADAIQHVRAAIVPSWLNSLRIWPAVMVINFAFIPPEFRSLLPGFVAVGWQVSLSILNQRTRTRLLETKLLEFEAQGSPDHPVPSFSDHRRIEVGK